jgi:O-antigen/teichoic acid export membrane protein
MPALVLRRMKASLSSGTGVWSVADQGVVSLGNFLLGFSLARLLPPEQYGIFAVLFSLMILLNLMHAALVVYPLSLDGAARMKRGIGTLAGAYMTNTLLCVTLASGLTSALCLHLRRSDLLLPVFAALVMWQIQETVRRALLAQMRFRAALPADVISYLGQSGCVWALWRTQHLTVASVYWTVAVTSALAWAIQAIQLGLKLPSRPELQAAVCGAWSLGLWAMLTNAVSSLCSVPYFVWMIGILGHPTEAGALQAVSNLLGVTHPILFGLSNLLIPVVAREHSLHGLTTAFRAALRCGGQFALLLCPYLFLTAIAPHRLLALLYGHKSPYLAFAALVPWLAVAYVFNFSGQLLGGYLRAVQKIKTDFAASVACACVSLGVYVSLQSIYPLTAAIVAMLTGSSIRAFLLYLACRRMLRVARSVEVSPI